MGTADAIGRRRRFATASGDRQPVTRHHPVQNGRATGGTYTIKYTIGNVEHVTGAHVAISAPGIGEVSPRVPVRVQRRGTAVVAIDPQRSDLGPTVRVRAVCPERTTEWYTFGSEPLPYKERRSRPLEIDSVHPPVHRLSHV